VRAAAALIGKAVAQCLVNSWLATVDGTVAGIAQCICALCTPNYLSGVFCLALTHYWHSGNIFCSDSEQRPAMSDFSMPPERRPPRDRSRPGAMLCPSGRLSAFQPLLC